MKLTHKDIKRLACRFKYRISFFLFLRKIENKTSLIFPFFPLLFYKVFPQYWNGYTTLVKMFGKKFIVRDLSDLMVIKETFYDQCYKSLFSDLINPTTLIDLGTFIGDVTIYSQRFPKVKKVFAVEPDPRNIKISKENFKINNIKNTILIPAAISGKTGFSHFKMGRENIASSLQEPKSTKKTIKVSTISLLKIMKMVKTPDIIIKSDCEGAEYDFIMQTPPHVLSKIKHFIFEYHMGRNKLNEVITHLKKAGFDTTYEDLILEPHVGMAYTHR